MLNIVRPVVSKPLLSSSKNPTLVGFFVGVGSGERT